MAVELTYVELMHSDRTKFLHEIPEGKSWFSAGDAIPLDFAGPVDIAFDRFEDKWIESPLVERFEQISLRYADRIAVDDGKTRLSYRALRGAVYRLARRIQAEAPERRPVGVLLPHNAYFPLAALACLAIGRPYVPIDMKHPAARILEIMGEADMGVVILDASTDAARLVPRALVQINIADALRANGEPSMPTGAAVSVDDPAVILYTSGSTGKPKGICNSQRGILQRAAASTNSCHVHADDRVILLSSPGTVAGVRETFTALLNGAALYIADPRQHGISGVLEVLRENRVSLCYTVPALLRTLLRAPGAQRAFSHLRIMRIAGDVTLISDLALCRSILPPACHFLVSFSSTEMPNAFQWFVPQDWKADGPRVPVGYPQPDIDFMVVDENDKPVAPGEVGELIVRSRYIAIGQWQHGRLQPEPFLRDPADPSMRIQRTSDMIKQRADGLWELVGRKDRQIKIRGQRVDPGEVEAVLRSCDVSDAAVIARRSGHEIIALVAYVVPRKPAKPELIDEIRQTLAARVPQHMRPAEIRLLDAIPQLHGFKPDIPMLERMDNEELQRTTTVRQLDRSVPPDSVRAVVEHAWTNVLGAKSYQADMRWDETDGDSLKAMELWFHIEQKLGRKISMDVLHDSTTPSSLAASIERYLDIPVGGDVGDQDAGRMPVMFLMPGILGDEPLLAQFRSAFGWNMRIKVIDYPEWRGAEDMHAGFDAIVDAAFAQICAEPACESYALAGYSFGGYVAFETARRLIASGRRVGFLGLLDSRMWGMSSAMGQSRVQALLAQFKRYGSLLADPVTLVRLVHKRCTSLVRFVAWAATSRPTTAISFTFYRESNYRQRLDALRRWKLTPLDLPMTLFLSDQGLADLPPDYGWGGLCKRLTIVRIGGTHASMLESPRRELLCTHLLDAILPTEPRLDQRHGAGWPDGRLA